MEPEIKQQLEILNQQVKELAALYHRAANGFDISDSEFWVWYALLVLGGGYSQQDICDLWSLPKQTVNSVVAGLIKKGYVDLAPVPGARNRKTIRPTETGRAYGEKIVRGVYETEQRAFSRIPAQERQAFIESLGKYISLLRRELAVERPALQIIKKG